MNTIAFHNLGCKVNAYEYERMQQSFLDKGYKIVAFDDKADIYIVNTCTVTNIADRKSRQMLHRAKALNPEAVIVAAGCYVDTFAPGNEDCSVDILIGNKDKENAVEIVEKYLNEQKKEFAISKDESSPINSTEDTALECDRENKASIFTKEDCGKEIKSNYSDITPDTGEHTRKYVKIQDGCNQFCSYCVIPYARGRIESRTKKDIISEVRGLAQKGYKEIVLTGIHLSSYGLDFEKNRKYGSYNDAAKTGGYTNRELLEIIKECAAVEGIRRIRLGSMEPRAMTDEFLKETSAIDEFCPHFHLSLQSGCDEVLKRMNRHYSTGEYLERVNKIREYFEHPAITTDVITGFPLETDEEAKETREYLNTVNLYETHVFKYSRRKGTTADKMPGQLTDRVKTDRSHILMAESKRRKDDFRKYYIGKNVEVLFEECQIIEGKSYYTGYSKEYVRFATPSNKELSNEIAIGSVKCILNDEFMLIEV